MNRASAERHIAAILVADIVGYSRLMGMDEAGTLRRLKALRRELIDPSIVTAHGRIVKAMGDGLLVEFPSPVRAVSCAVQIQRAMLTREANLPADRAFRLRFGINLGDVVAERDGDLYGDGVNVAARLESLAEPGGLCISRSVHEQVRDKVPYRFEDRGKLELKNIARPVGVFALSAASLASLAVPDAENEAEEAGPDPAHDVSKEARSRTARRILLAASLAATIAAGGLGWWSWSAQRAAEPASLIAQQVSSPLKPVPGLSLVVLPFANHSNDPEQDFFADGLTEDLTTDLSHLAGSFVIARNTAFTYKGKAVDVKQLGRDLGVRYALEGSVRRTSERVVVNAQLISTETGAHIWADRIEGERSRLGELQVEFVARLARSLDVQLTQAESLRALRERPNNPDAADLSMRGWAALNRPRSLGNADEASALFERALQLDPDLSEAVLGFARATILKVTARWSLDRTKDISLADEKVRLVLDNKPDYAKAQFVKGEILRGKKDFDGALYMYDVAVQNDRSFAEAYANTGLAKILSGSSAESFDFVRKAIRLSPKDNLINIWYYYICHAHTHLAQWEQAIEWCNKSIAHGPFWIAYADIATAYAWTGRHAEARGAIAELLKIMPGYTVQKWATTDWSDNPTFLVEYQRMTEGLRKAGLPES
ncbi:adenylate/guanylate cyclase domain-containing protein [Methylobacterium soli]|uniref:Adenylate/guanylate cyclase domain-containing protein n=1 Tax=Methylobacterium soli TaxID=553447 RepID=A0A6L3SPX2_9HYPH|nr:adenylate/guanylate cyclase domain-containing protein [Methylobacterium soli]KAB1072366.1 adenylate/guanylate cyclase domain-containing protein [Methylobacterium soli]GJE46862.1 hypothetical protein AEGHOMDF_6071 [Methylobacterium soli]